MRILWIGKPLTCEENGGEIFDRKTIAACRSQGQHIDTFHPLQVGRPREIFNLMSGLPYYRARFKSTSNVHGIRSTSSEYDVAICSWEPYDALARMAVTPTVLILHNVTSRALPELFPRNPIAALGAAAVRAWEHQCYRRENFAAVAALSRRDRDYLAGLKDAPRVLLLPPGMPPCVDLASEAALVTEIVISGTFGWTPKRRDALRFARDYAALDQRLPIRADALPPDAARLLQPLPVPSIDETGTAIRFGLITDRFEAGHKLKTMAYVANNQVVLSFADVGFDFAHIPDHDFFIRKIESVAEINVQVRSLSVLPAAILRERFLRFQRACAEYFNWNTVATILLEAAREASARRNASAIAYPLPGLPPGGEAALRNGHGR